MKLTFKYELTGHQGSVEGLSFSPKDKDLLVSVGVDKKIIGWDLRSSNKITFKVIV
jgi:WD40 repeat protein